MKTIWKYPLKTADQQPIIMPKGAQLLTVQMQHGKACLWALVDPNGYEVSREIHVYGTGHKIDRHDLIYISSIQMMGGDVVFHVFDGGEKP